MGVIWTSRKAFQQPRGRVQLAPDYARASLSAIASDPKRLIKTSGSINRLDSVDGYSATARGRAWAVTSAATNHIQLLDVVGSQHYLSIPADGSWTVLIHAKINAMSGANPGFFRSDSVSGGATFFIVDGTGNSPWVRVGGVNVLRPSSGAAIAVGQDTVFVCSMKSSERVDVAWDGKVQHSATHATAQTGDGVFFFGWQSSVTESVQGDYYSITWLPWALSPAKTAELSTPKGYYSNVFAPRRRPVFYSLPAVGGTSSAVVWNARTRSRQPQTLARPAGSLRAGLYSLRALTGPAAADSVSGGRGTPSSGVSATVLSGLRGVAFAATSDAISLPARETDTGGGNFSALLVGRVSTGAYRFAGSSLTGDTYTWGHSSTNLLFTLVSVADLNSSIVLADGSLVAVLYSYVRGVGVTFTKCDLRTGFVEQEAVSSSSVPNINAGGAYIGCRNLDFGWNAPLFMEARWRKAVDYATARALVRNPWQLFAPERRPKFFSVGSGANTYAATISETATASETAAAVATFLGSISETVTANETMIARAVFGSTVAETVTASETVSTIATLNSTISETATASDSISSIVAFTSTISETATASETMAAALGAATFAAAISETATASETASTLVSLQAAISETATASDSISSLVAFISAVSETATASDSIAAQLANQTYAADISETATASDVIVATMPTIYAASIIETISISDIAAAGVPSSDFWTQISTTQVAGWGQTDNTQSSGWTIIPTT